MKLSLFVTAAFFFLFAAQLKAQQNDFADKVYLKNGSLIIGKIIYYLPNDTLKLQMSSGQIAQFLPEQIKKIAMYDATKGKVNKVEKPYSFREHGLYNALSFNLNLGRGTSETHKGIGIQNVFGYQFNRLVGGGIGVGNDSYYLSNGESSVVSIFGEYRGYLSQRNISEYWTFAAGYGQPSKIKNDIFTNQKGSFMVQPTIGFRFDTPYKYSFFTDLGFRMQQIRFQNNNTWAENHYTVTYRRWVLRGGILF